jgi:hypothetical protein
VTKIRTCKRGCGYQALPRRQFCHWHALMREPIAVQIQAAADRRERQLGHDGVDYVARVPKDRWPPGERWCAGCQSFVPTFYCSGSRCKACASAATHAKRIEKVYGISAEEYDALLEKQKGCCAICRAVPKTTRLAVDHDHQTGEVRGLLCKRCNHDLLGAGHDGIELHLRAIAYLIYPTAKWNSIGFPIDAGAAIKTLLTYA